MFDHLSRGRSVLLQHLLDQVDAPARRIELVAEQYVGRTSCGAEAAMHASAQDFFRGGDLRIFQLRESERSLHQLHTRPHATGIEHARWIETFLHALAQGARGGILRREDLDRGSHRSRSAYQRGMTAEYGHGT